MIKHPLVSVIVPVYKVEQYLDNCLNSLLSQTYPYWEAILVDDGSPDRCPQICDEYAAKDSRFRVIHQQNKGLSSARNAALLCITGQYVAFLDSDDYWHVDYLKILVDLCLRYNAEIAQCDFIRGTETHFPKWGEKKRTEIFDNHEIFLHRSAKIVVWGKLYHKCIVEGIEMPVGKVNEDDFTTWKYYFRAKRIAVINCPLYYYTYNPDSTMARQKIDLKLDFLEAYAERINYFESIGMQDMIDISRFQLCKSLFLSSTSPNVSKEKKDLLRAKFLEHWKILKGSAYVSSSYKCLFDFYSLFPTFTRSMRKVWKRRV